MKILVASGSSGGHIFPAQSLLDSLKEKDRHIDTLLVLPQRSILDDVAQGNYQVKFIALDTIRFSLDFQNILAILKFFKAFAVCLRIFLRFRPDIVVGFGSLNCIPLVLWAKVFGVKVLLHEQNVIPGRANKFLSVFADKIAVSFEKTRDYLKKYQAKIVFTGNPLRRKLVKMAKTEARAFLGLSDNKFTILVSGGSQASHKINLGVLRAVSGPTFKSGLQIIHLSGRQDFELLETGYKKLDLKSRVFAFFDEMQYAYSACDLVISRAGATTIFEIMFYELAAILIPYPYAHKHQMANAEFMQEKSLAVIIPDNELDQDVLGKAIENFMRNPEQLKGMCSGYNKINKYNASDLLVQAALSLN